MGSRNAGRFFIPTAVKQTIKRISDSERQLNKMEAHALQYGMGDQRLINENKASNLLHMLLHIWNLPEDIQQQCTIYELRAMYASQVADNLQHHNGLVGFRGKLFSPVYQNCSRMDIGTQANSKTPDRHKYYVSFRQYGALRIAVIQPAREETGKY